MICVLPAKQQVSATPVLVGSCLIDQAYRFRPIGSGLSVQAYRFKALGSGLRYGAHRDCEGPRIGQTVAMPGQLGSRMSSRPDPFAALNTGHSPPSVGLSF